jgi:hypothetical protein
MALPRILAVEESFGLNDWLNRMKTMHRYVSDGDPNTISVPKSRANLVDKSRLKGQTVRVY